MIEITVKVPEDRVAEFYVMHGEWLRKVADEEATPAPRRRWTTKDGDLARQVWAKLPPKPAKMLELLIEAGQMDAAALVAGLGFSDASQIVGVHGWVGRVCNEFGMFSPIEAKTADGATVWSLDPEIGRLFAEAR